MFLMLYCRDRGRPTNKKAQNATRIYQFRHQLPWLRMWSEMNRWGWLTASVTDTGDAGRFGERSSILFKALWRPLPPPPPTGCDRLKKTCKNTSKCWCFLTSTNELAGDQKSWPKHHYFLTFFGPRFSRPGSTDQQKGTKYHYNLSFLTSIPSIQKSNSREWLTGAT